MAPFAARLDGARKLAAREAAGRGEGEGKGRIRATGVEARFGTRYTVDTLHALTRRWPRARFVWLMGADNLVQLPEWRNWAEIFGILPVAVFDRPSYSGRTLAGKALAGKAAQRFGDRRLDESEARFLAEKAPPAWVFLHTALNPASATEIRGRRGR